VATPHGIIFWGTDRTVQLLDLTFLLRDISKPVYPVLRRATKGQEAKASGAYFNWLEREWYALTLPLDGSFSNNFIIFWGLQQDTSQMDIFLSNIQADFLSTVSTPQQQRQLLISQNGKILTLPVSQDTVNGIAQLNLIPATNGVLPAYYRGGYYGNDSPYRNKMYRRGLLITDQDGAGFSTTLRGVNNKEFTLVNPDLIPITPVGDDGTFEINYKYARLSVEINFPQQDVSANVLELSVGAIPTADRL
jgi:hypothetical protein